MDGIPAHPGKGRCDAPPNLTPRGPYPAGGVERYGTNEKEPSLHCAGQGVVPPRPRVAAERGPCVFAACGGEFGVMGWIKTTKDKHITRKWELEDRKFLSEKEDDEV